MAKAKGIQAHRS